MIYIPKNPAAHMKAKKSKYRNKVVYAQGKRFDSIKERDRFFFLQDAQRRGEIMNLRCQVSFDLDVNGEHICRYVADFVYEKSCMDLTAGAVNSVNRTGRFTKGKTVVEDVKARATKTDTYRLKNKLMKAVHGVEIREVFEPTLPI